MNEFLVGVDETLELLSMDGDVDNEKSSSALVALFESIGSIIDKSDSEEIEDIIEFVVVEYPRILSNLMRISDLSCQSETQLDDVDLAVAKLIGLFMSGNFRTS